MEISLELVSPHNCLVGFSYRSGTGINQKDEQVKFHEIGFGFLFGALYITLY